MNTHLQNNTNVKQAVPFFMVSNMETSLRFYINGLGFELKNKWEPRGKIEWCWLQLENAAIMLQEYRNNIPNEKRGLGFSVCFICENALLIYEQTTSHGLSPKEPFVGNNMWVVGFKDPDGYAIYFESPTDTPEETTYTEWKKKSEMD